MMRAGAVDAMAALGPEWDAVFAAGPGLQSRRAWFEATAAAALPAGAQPYLVTVVQDGRPAALLPMRRDGGRLASLTSPYTTAFQPLLAPGTDPLAAGVALGRHLRQWPLLRIEALDPDWPGLSPLLAGLRQGGLVSYRFDHFGTWWEDVAGLDWPAYLARRPGALRETIRRRGNAVAKDASVRIAVVRGDEGLAAALADYEAVYRRSWKEAEPYPGFNAALLPRVAAMGALRMGVLRQGDVPLAAQYWTVQDGVATVLKLAHDDKAKALSPGTVLTAHMIRLLLTEGGVERLDFGRGDDPYKASWTGTRQQRVGVIAANPYRVAGAADLARHLAGRVRRGFKGWRRDPT